MTYNRFISTAVLLMLLGITLSAFAQKGEEEKGSGGGRAPQAQHQAQPQHAQQAQNQGQPQHAQQAEHQAQPQHSQQAQHQSQPQLSQRAQPEPAQQAQHQAQPQHSQQAQRQAPQSRGQQQTVGYNRGDNGNHGNHGNGNYGRISNANYSSHFGHDHSFHMGRPEMIGGYNRFQYGGYWFGYNEGWPMGWDYDDDCYVVYEAGAYYMYNLRHPGIHISLNIF